MRQYIGARYVPKFMGTYDNTQVYEALSVVDNGMGTSYIAKIPTPANTPLTDTAYWAIYGASSGAIISLQDQINDMNDGTVPGSLQNQINTMNDGTVPGSLQDQITDNASDIAALTSAVESGLSVANFVAENFDLNIIDVLNPSSAYTFRLAQCGRQVTLDISINTSGALVPANTVFNRRAIPAYLPYNIGLILNAVDGTHYRFVINQDGFIRNLADIPAGKLIEGNLCFIAYNWLWVPKITTPYAYIYNHKLVTNKEPNNPSGTSNYMGLDMGAGRYGKEFKVRFTLEDQKVDGTGALIFTPIGNTSGGQILTKSLHIVFKRTYIAVGLYTNSVYDYFNEHTFGTPLVKDNNTEHEITVVVTGNTITLQVDSMTFTDVIPNTWNVADYNGRYGIFEFYCEGNRDFVSMPEYTFMRIVDNNNDVIYDDFQRANGVVTTTTSGDPYSLFN